MKADINIALLRLFNTVQVDNKQAKTIDPATLERTIQNGFVLDPAISVDDKLLDVIESVVGISGEKANAAFHKSWTVIQNSTIKQLVSHQIAHYITTYGFKSLGIYQKESVYIPHEILELPDIQTDIPLTVIKAMTKEEVLEKIIDLGSGIALAQETLDDIMVILEHNKYDSEFVQKIQNRELKTLLYDFYDLAPTDPEAFLRYLISKLTDESLVIKNKDLIQKIKAANGKFLDTLLKDAPDDLASIFLRFKPLFLALKSISRNKTFFNQLRKKAVKLHKPVPEDYLNSVTAQIKHETLDLAALKQKLTKATIFRKIRLAYALQHRLHAGQSIVYRVRNGNGWATEFNWPEGLAHATQQALDTVIASIADDIQPNVDGKTIYIPPHIHYALPATEKQFTGYLPTGTYVSVPQDMIAGIHWINAGKNKSVDLDLSMIGKRGKIGWDADYRSKDSAILFSGDMTDAPWPKGASELFYFKKDMQEVGIFMVNYYNFQQGDEVMCKFLVAQEQPTNFGSNYMVDINNIIASANINLTKKQNVLGLVANVNGENRFYFANMSIGKSITASQNTQSMQAREYLVSSAINTVDFRQVLTMAGANVVDEKPDNEYIDLSPEALDKTTIIDLVQAKM
ncbi:hypothetical protein [Candidatus Albibeggiatoa sp. nov. NOAA]|uniref:hypothetical protein n=1 Tax=Candidatus Albibeggiatoa sp. nov. NOAA TaxID=3162724 RepID=UPI0032FEF5B7|nr:hypothetical protein [Thiotrichaceae bacterium]